MDMNHTKMILDERKDCYGCKRVLEKGKEVECRHSFKQGVMSSKYFCPTCVAVAEQRGWDLGKQKFAGSIKRTHLEFWNEAYIVTEGILSRYQKVSKADYQALIYKETLASRGIKLL